MTGIEPRRASIEDAAEISRLHGECFADQPWSRNSIVQMIADPVTFGYLADQVLVGGSEPVGFCLARIASGECELLSLGVLHEARRRGHGRKLLEAVKAQTRNRRCERVYLEVAETNDPALRLYLDSGFAVIGRRKAYYRAPKGVVIDALVLGTVGCLA